MVRFTWQQPPHPSSNLPSFVQFIQSIYHGLLGGRRRTCTATLSTQGLPTTTHWFAVQRNLLWPMPASTAPSCTTMAPTFLDNTAFVRPNHGTPTTCTRGKTPRPALQSTSDDPAGKKKEKRKKRKPKQGGRHPFWWCYSIQCGPTVVDINSSHPSPWFASRIVPSYPFPFLPAKK